jgi:hypothetical protein
MEQYYIDVDKKWGIVIVTDFDVDEEYIELKAQLRSFGLSSKNADKALNVLSNYNTGMAVSVSTLRMTAIYISKATSPSQFWDTLNHELYHACVAIIDYYGEPYDQEPAAYLQGYLMRRAVETIGEPCN